MISLAEILAAYNIQNKTNYGSVQEFANALAKSALKQYWVSLRMKQAHDIADIEMKEL